MKFLVVACSIAYAFSAMGAQVSTWHPSPGHAEVALWPGRAPAARATRDSESMGIAPGKGVAGKPWTYVANVSRPTLSLYSPSGRNTGAAVLVFPGGGYSVDNVNQALT